MKGPIRHLFVLATLLLGAGTTLMACGSSSSTPAGPAPTDSGVITDGDAASSDADGSGAPDSPVEAETGSDATSPVEAGTDVDAGNDSEILVDADAAGDTATAPEGGKTIVFSRPPGSAGTLIVSSWVDPNGSDSDMYAYDSFLVDADADITEVQWRGGYTQNAVYGMVNTFSIVFYESIQGGSQPHVTNPQLPETFLAWYDVAGNAEETPAGTFGGTAMYDYQYSLPTPFHAVANTKYWLRIEAAQPTYPDWGIAAGTGGDGTYFRFSTGLAMFQDVPGDTAFTLR